ACCGPCEARHDGNCKGHVDFAVRLPPASELAAANVSGDITVSGVRGRQTLTTVSGDVAWNGLCAKECRIDATTVSGDVRLGIAPQSSFALEYGSVSGSFKDGIATTILEQAGRPGARVRAHYGKGEGAIACTTVSGDLALERK